MNNDTTSTLRLITAIILGVMFIAAGIGGRPGSIIGSLIDAEDMSETGGSASGDF
jgi:hypothetical protein